MELKAGYKQTEVGVIPEDWEVTEVRNIVGNSKIPSGIYKDKNLYGQGTKIVKLGDVFGCDYFIPEIAQKVQLTKKELLAYQVKINDIFIALASVKLEGVGKVMLVNSLDEETAYDHNVALIRVIDSFNPKYICNLFKSNVVRNQIASQATQVGTTFLKSSTILKFKIPVPPTKAEQAAIATALSDVDALISALDKLITKKRLIKQGAMQELLSGKKRLAGFSGEWKVKKLEDLAKIQRGASPRPIDSPIWFDEKSNIGWVRISDLTKSFKYLKNTVQKLSELGIKQSRFVNSDSLIMSICATVGRPIITKIDVCIHDGFVLFSNLEINKEFLYYFLTFIENDWGKNGQTGSQMNLNTKLINSVDVGFPESKKEQTAIAQILSDMDTDIQSLEIERNKTLAIKQGMMQELLTGKTRLI